MLQRIPGRIHLLVIKDSEPSGLIVGLQCSYILVHVKKLSFNQFLRHVSSATRGNRCGPVCMSLCPSVCQVVV